MWLVILHKQDHARMSFGDHRGIGLAFQWSSSSVLIVKRGHPSKIWNTITLLRVIPTMTFIHFLTRKSSGILSDISSGILSGILSGISSGICSDISSGILSDIPSGISSGILSGRWGLAVPTGIWSSRLRSGSAHWDLEVRQCPLRPGSRGWGPAVPTAICNSWLRSGSAHWDLELAVEVRLCRLGSGLRGGGGGWGGGGGGEELC